MRLIIATSNEDKVREIDEILEGTGFKAVSMKKAGFDPEIVEDGATFEENAMKKASAVHALAGPDDYVMADDSGLCIDALDGAPGIYSARFCGENSTYPEKFAKIFQMLEGVPEAKRTARFVCAIAVVKPDGSSFTVRGETEGILHEKPAGSNGFGYDPIFYVPEFGMTTAEMPPEQKHSISHRGRAIRKMVERLTKEI